MKVVILAGGFGTRLSEETDIRPKPMVEIGGMPILWHIMKLYSHYGFHEFVILLGYKGYMIKDFFNTYFLRRSDFVIDLKDNSRTIIKDIKSRVINSIAIPVLTIPLFFSIKMQFLCHFRKMIF